MGKIYPGDTLQTLPSEDWNRFHDTTKAVRELQRGGNGTGVSSGNPSAVEVLVKNMASEDLTVEFPIVKLGDSVITSDRVKRQRITLEGTAPVAGEPFAVLTGPVKDGKFREATVFGMAVCQVSVGDVGHGFAAAEDDNYDYLVSGESGVPIVWKQSGTGLKYAIVQLGASGEGNAVAVMVHGPAASDVSSGVYTLTISECTIIQGQIPDDVTTITANDTHSWGIVEDQLVWVILPAGDVVGTDNFLTFQAGCPPEAP